MRRTASAPIRRGVVDVEDADGEILPQHRKRAGRTGRPQVVGRTSEELPVGEYRQARRPSTLVGGGHLGRIEPGVEIALRRRAALDLRDDRDRFARSTDRLDERADRRRRECLFEHILFVAGVGGNRGPVCLDDGVEIGRHGIKRLPVASCVPVTRWRRGLILS